jgi:hypothetical protein
MDSRPERRHTWRYTSSCPGAAGTGRGVATKEMSSMRHQRTAGRACALARHAGSSTLYVGVEEPRRR